MEKIVAFIVENWKLVAFGLLAIFELVLFLVKKKPVKVVDSIYQEVTDLLLTAINVCERPGDGANKRSEVLGVIQEWLIEKHPEVDIRIYMDFASRMIEYILSTPQKKGE